MLLDGGVYLNYLIITVIGGVLLFGIIYFLPLKLKLLDKLGFVIISLILANLFLYSYPILGIWRSATIVYLLVFLSTFFMLKKVFFGLSTIGVQTLKKDERKAVFEEKKDISLEGDFHPTIIAPLNDEKDNQLIVNKEDFGVVVSALDNYQLDVDESEPFERQMAHSETVEELIENTVEQDSRQPLLKDSDLLGEIAILEGETAFNDFEVIEEIAWVEQLEKDPKVEINFETKTKENLDQIPPELNEDEAVFLNREVRLASEDDMADMVEEMSTNENNSLSREKLFSLLETEQ
ncbi:hypothetical protein RJD24_15935 [Bacillaceae bacterium IKA-2]|nr:hypothetical protein RJD24_15935 [Bacillaceae bacterium IKA-2]